MNQKRVNDPGRLRAVRESGLLEMGAQEAFDRMTRLAARALSVPAAFLSVVDAERDVYLSQCGFGEPLASEREMRGETFCHHTITGDGPLVIEDARAHPVYRHVPTVESLGVAAYLGVPVRLPGGEVMGAICAIDVRPRTWSAIEVEIMQEMAASAERELALRAATRSASERAGEAERAAEHMRAEVARRETAEARYRRLVETSPYGIFAVDAGGVLREGNAALGEILGRPTAQLLDAPVLELAEEEARESAGAWLRDALRGDAATVQGELQVRRADGTRRRVHIRAVPVREGDAVVGLHGVARDVTEERQRERLVRRSQRLASLGTLVGGVAHELNNPLTAVRGFAQLLHMDATSAEERETLQLMRGELDRMARVIADLRTVAQRAAEETAPRQPVDLNEVVRQTVRLREHALRASGIQLEEQLAPQLPPVRANHAELEQVVLNLIVNAEQAMAAAPERPERRLSLRTRAARGAVLLEVADTGPGIADDIRDRIFDPFFTTRQAGEGAGLGLSLVHSIIAEHGGEVRVRSRAGDGAVFQVELQGMRTTEAPPSAAPAPAATPTSARRILVVDDEPSIRSVLHRFLTRRGHRVTLTASAEEALLEIDRTDFDVVISDLRMPGAGGGAVLQRLAASGRRERLILITGDVEAELAREVRARGEIPVLEKPVDFGMLAALVEEE